MLIRRPLGVNRRVRTLSPLLALETDLLFTWLRSLQFDTLWLPTAPKMEAIWIPKVVDFRSHENLDFGDPSHSLEGPRESKVDAFCTLFQLLSRASDERSPGHTFCQILDPFGNQK